MDDRASLQGEIDVLNEVMVRARQDASKLTTEIEESRKLVVEIQKKKMASLLITDKIYREFYE